MPNARIQNSVSNSRLRSDNPNARVSSFQVGRSGVGEIINPIVAGMPIGLLLVLTYAESAISGNEASYGDFRPNVRIVNI